MDETFGPDNADKWNAKVVGFCDGCRAGHRANSILHNRDELDPTVGARFQFWRDEPSVNGHES